MEAGVYTANRAVALSGVPKSMVYHWARKGILVPTVAREPMLWSYADLLGLRAIYWLRQTKEAFDREVQTASMPKIQRALDELKRVDLNLLSEGRPIIAVTLLGEVTVGTGPLALDQLDLLGPFQGLEGTQRPDLAWPRPTVQILPGKISGAPHVAGTRVTTESLFALSARGFTVEQVAKIYPFVDRQSLKDSVSLEEQLKRNCLPKAAHLKTLLYRVEEVAARSEGCIVGSSRRCSRDCSRRCSRDCSRCCS